MARTLQPVPSLSSSEKKEEIILERIEALEGMVFWEIL
jgi:hypothetical protein